MIKGARAIFDSNVYNFVKSCDLWNSNDESMTYANVNKFVSTYKLKLSEYKYSQLQGLGKYKFVNVVDGVTGAFLDWYITFGIKNIFVLKGEYPFHKANGCKEVDTVYQVPMYKTLILSLPFSATGNVHENFYEILETCVDRKINLLIDCAYLNISSIGKINIDCIQIQSIATSLSKVYNTGSNRIGLQFNRYDKNSPYKELNNWSYLNHHSINLHTQLLNKFKLSYTLEKYQQTQKTICNKYNLDKSDTVIFGLSNAEKYNSYNRSGIINRICISKEIQDANNIQ